jgi:anthranilate/para-aminobenzoate synthase component I
MIRELGRMSRGRMIAAAHTADRGGRAVALLTGDGWGAVELGIDPVADVRVPLGPDAMDHIERFLEQKIDKVDLLGWNGRSAAARWIGYIAYDAARSLERGAWSPVERRDAPIGAAMVLRRFAAVARRDEQSGIVAIEGDDAASIDALASLLTREHPPPARVTIELAPVDDDRVHRARIEHALALIARGDLYQVNLARTFVGETRASATEILAALLTRASARFGAALDFGDHALVCSSPELFLDVDATHVRTSPIKGTRPRGHDRASDAAQRSALAGDPKEHAELTMVVDLERNDLGRIADVGSVRVLGEPHIETSRTVHHRVADVVARHHASLGAIVRATFPSGSVTGAPKIRAMEVIASLERDRRGIYCGAIVRIGRDGRLRAAMAIRTLVVDRSTGVAVYHAGGGIVADSDPDREVVETLWKARQVLPSVAG